MIHRLLFWPKFPQKTLFWFIPLSARWTRLGVSSGHPWRDYLLSSPNPLEEGVYPRHTLSTSLFPTRLILFCEKLLFVSCCWGSQSCPNTKQWVTHCLHPFLSLPQTWRSTLQEGTRHFCCLFDRCPLSSIHPIYTADTDNFPSGFSYLRMSIHSQKKSWTNLNTFV